MVVFYWLQTLLERVSWGFNERQTTFLAPKPMEPNVFVFVEPLELRTQLVQYAHVNKGVEYPLKVM